MSIHLDFPENVTEEVLAEPVKHILGVNEIKKIGILLTCFSNALYVSLRQISFFSPNYTINAFSFISKICIAFVSNFY